MIEDPSALTDTHVERTHETPTGLTTEDVNVVGDAGVIQCGPEIVQGPDLLFAVVVVICLDHGIRLTTSAHQRAAQIHAVKSSAPGAARLVQRLLDSRADVTVLA